MNLGFITAFNVLILFQNLTVIDLNCTTIINSAVTGSMHLSYDNDDNGSKLKYICFLTIMEGIN